MAEAAYILCFLTAAAVAFLLLRAHVRTRARILFWTGLGFVGLCLYNGMIILDLLIFPAADLSAFRDLPAIAGTGLIIFGLIWDAE